MSITFLTNEDEKSFVKSINGVKPNPETGDVQISIPNSGGNVDQIKEYPASAFTLNHRIVTGGVDKVDLTPTAIQGWACIAVPCEAGTVATFSAHGGVAPRAWACVADDGTVLSSSEENAELADYELAIPQKCTLVINASVKSSYTYYLKLRVKGTANAAVSLSGRFATDMWCDADNWQSGHIQTGLAVGSTVDFSTVTEANYSRLILDCYTGMKFKIAGRGGAKCRLWCFVDNENVIHSVSGEYAANAEVEAPIDGKIIIQSETSNKSYPKSVQYTAYSLAPVAKVVERLTPTFNGALVFGDGINLKYEAPEIEALPTKADYGVAYTEVSYDRNAYTIGQIIRVANNATVDLSAPESFQGWALLMIPCVKGTVATITGDGGVAGRAWALVANDGTVLSRAGEYAVCNGTEVVIDTDCTLVVHAMSNDSKERHVELKIPRSGVLEYYYGLYDALVAAHPDYVSKVDCDAELAAAGIVRPDYYADYPTYMYKFIPAYASNSSALDGVSDASRFKVYILSGTHPEMMSIWDLYNTMRLICDEWKDDENLEALRWQCEFYIIPLSCPYCVANATRPNYNGVDPNRNAPTSDWTLTPSGTNTYSGSEPASEYETKLFAYYMQEIKPHVFIDHHNTEAVSDPGTFMYVTSKRKANIDVAAAHISTMSRRWKKRFPDVLPNDNTTLFGFVHNTNDTGVRATYGHECGAYSYVFETQHCLAYDNGVPTDNAHYADSVACTIATDGFANFLLTALRNAAQRISAQVVE